MSELGNSLPPPVHGISQGSVMWGSILGRVKLTGGYQYTTITHDAAHEFGPVTPPLWNGCSVVIEMALAFILDIEREDVVGQVFPFRSAFD